ncbi:MAG: extracellular solute-binding protein [Chloroflexi bacterium]|nr:extracellular solute-binding protein [Chloroflexota bacterium]
MNRLLSVWIIVLLAGLLSGSCKQAAPPAPAEELKAPAAKATGSVSRAAWEQEWESVLAGARKEGALSFMGSVGGPFRDVGAEKHLKEKYGLTMDIIAGGASELIPKLVAERRAGILRGDVFILSTASMANGLKPSGLTESLDRIIFLPEALDPKAWYKGDVPWVDKDHNQIALLGLPMAPVVVNTEVVKPGEIKSYRDILNPKWKGRIALMDPTQSGAGTMWFQAMAEGIMDLNYLREFARQEPTITRTDRLMGEWVSRGRYPISVGLGNKIVEEFKRVGSPIESVIPAEGTYVYTSSGAIVMLKNPEHPNAAKLFVNWILTKEGITWLSRAYGGQSSRVDVPTDFLDQKQLRQPGVKYLNLDSEELAMKGPEYYKLAAEVFAGSLK